MADSYEIKVDCSDLGQLIDSTCWLAAYKMLFKAAKQPDCSIAADIRAYSKKANDATIDYDDFYYHGLPPEKYKPCRNALKLDSFSKSYITGLVDDPDGFTLFLKTRGPIWTSIKRGGKLHIILVNGYRGAMKQVQALNPWSNISAGSVETMYIPFSDFKSWVTSDDASCQCHPSWQPIAADAK